MPLALPFHRTYRGIAASGPNAGYSKWAYIRDKAYAKNPEHYVRAFVLIQDDLRQIFEYVEPSDECRPAFSYRIHALFMRTCIEIEANFKAIMQDNIFTASGRPNLSHYRKVDESHHLSSYEILLPIWHGGGRILRPFEPWKATRGASAGHASIAWYQAYNSAKHDRQNEFKEANLENLVDAVAGLLVLISSQFASEDFSARATSLGLGAAYDYHDLEPAIGDFFRIKFPDDWTSAEEYDFDWKVLEKQTVRFAKFNYDAVP